MRTRTYEKFQLHLAKTYRELCIINFLLQLADFFYFHKEPECIFSASFFREFKTFISQMRVFFEKDPFAENLDKKLMSSLLNSKLF